MQQPCDDDIAPIEDKIVLNGVEYTRTSEAQTQSNLSIDDDIIRIDGSRPDDGGESAIQSSNIRQEEEASLPPIHYREDYIEEDMMSNGQQIDSAEVYNGVYEELNSSLATKSDDSSSTVDQFWAWALRTSLPESRKTRKTRMQMFAYLSQPSKGCFCFAILIFNYFYDYI